MLVLGSLLYFDFSDFTRKSVEDRLRNETRLYSKNLENAFMSVEAFSRITSATPPFQGIIRSIDNSGIDPKDGSKLHTWKDRLATIFISILRENDYYTQLRYIELANGGKELVRVDRDSSRIYRIEESKLQKKANEPYFKNSLGLQKGNIYFSDITLNREHGEVTSEKTVTLRAVYPIYKDQTEEMFGFFVINLDFEKFLMKYMPKISLNAKIEVGTNTGSHITRELDDKFTRLQFKDNFNPDFKVAPNVLSSDEDSGLIETEDWVSFFKKYFYNSQDLKDYVYVKLIFPRENLFFEYDNLLRRNLLLCLGIILSFSFLFLMLSQSLLNPLKTMTRKILNAKKHSHKLYVDTNLPSELGFLAESFKELADELHENFTKSETILNNIADGVISISSKGIILSCNQSVEKMFGYELSYLIGKNVSILMPQEYADNHDYFLERYFETMEAKVIGQKRELVAKKMDNELFPIELSVEEVIVGKKVIFIGVIRDISKRKKNEEKLLKTFNHLKANKQELEVFNEVVLHDFEEPLKEIKLEISKIKESHIAEESQLYLKDIKQKISLLYERLRSFRDYLTLDKLEETQGDYELETLVNKAVNGNKDRQALKIHYVNGAESFKLSSNAIEKVFQCILEDSFQLNNTIEKNIWIKVESQGGIARFEIKDDSISKPAVVLNENQNTELSSYSVQNKFKTESIELSIARKLINKHGGRLVVSWGKASVRTYIFTWPEAKTKSKKHLNSFFM